MPRRALAAVMAGGAGSRLGGAKALTPLAGRPLIARPVAAALASGLDTVVVAKDDSPLPRLPCPVVHEPPTPRHPLCGIVTALRHAAGAPVLALGCDMPLLSPLLLAWLAGMGGDVVVAQGGRLHPLLARYTPEQLPALEAALIEQAPMRETVRRLAPTIVEDLDLARFGDPATLCFNVNDPIDVVEAEALLAEAAARG